MGVGAIGGGPVRKSWSVESDAKKPSSGTKSKSPPPAAMDTLEGFPSARSRERAAVASEVRRLASDVGEATERFRAVARLGADLDGNSVARLTAQTERLAGRVGLVARAVELGALAVEFPDATGRLNRALDAHLADPSSRTASELRAAMAEWNQSMQAVADLIPDPFVAKHVALMLDAGTRAIGHLAVVFADRAEHAHRVADGNGELRPVGAPGRVRSAPADGSPLRGLTTAVGESVAAWQEATGIRDLPEGVAVALERAESLCAELEQNRKEWSEASSFLRGLRFRGENARARELVGELGEALGELTRATREAGGILHQTELGGLAERAFEVVFGVAYR